VIFLRFDQSQDLQEPKPAYRITAARMLAPDPEQTDTVGCTYAGPSAYGEYDASGFIQSAKVGFVSFDLTAPGTVAYAGQLISLEGPSQTVTQTCPNGTDSRDHGRGPHSWLDTTSFPDGRSTVTVADPDSTRLLIADGRRSGDAGYSDLAWFFASCRDFPGPCDDLVKWSKEELLQRIEGQIESFQSGESAAILGTGARAEASGSP